jgi:hypothetical protein
LKFEFRISVKSLPCKNVVFNIRLWRPKKTLFFKFIWRLHVSCHLTMLQFIQSDFGHTHTTWGQLFLATEFPTLKMIGVWLEKWTRIDPKHSTPWLTLIWSSEEENTWLPGVPWSETFNASVWITKLVYYKLQQKILHGTWNIAEIVLNCIVWRNHFEQ